MALFAVYLVKNGDNRLHVFFRDIRREGSVEHNCWLPPQNPDRPWLVREISDQLEVMGFELEYDQKLTAVEGELHIMASYVVPDGAGSAAEAIRAVCTRHAITPNIETSVSQTRLMQLG